MTASTRRAAKLIAAVALTLVWGGCTDLPTGADSFQLEADGQLWTAIVAPAGLPSADTWLEFAPDASAAARDARLTVAGLESAAMRARAVGDLDRAAALTTEAARQAIGLMVRRPGPGVFITGVASLEAWERSVSAEVDFSHLPALSAAVTEVAQARESAEQALREGDHRAAAMHLTRAAERVRDWSPQGVALRVLGRVESHLSAAAGSPAEVERARHLVQSAREELLDGEPLRAVQRALYALQLAGGSQLQELPAEDRPRCGEFSC